MATAVDVDLRIDLQTMDETGLPWTFLDQAPDPSRIMPGRHIVAGSGAAVAVVVVVDITDEGIVHVQPLKGSVASNAHLLGADPASRRLPDLLADPVEAAGTDRNETAPSSAETPGTTGGRALDGTGRNEVRRLITRRSVAHPLFVALDLAQDRARGREILDVWRPTEVRRV